TSDAGTLPDPSEYLGMTGRPKECTSTMCSDTHLPAINQQRACGAFRQISCANVLAERHEQGVRLDPVLPREDLVKRDHRLLRRGGVNDAPAVAHAVNVNV